MKDAANALRLRLVVGALPRPMRRGEVQAHQERLPRPRVAVDRLDRAVAEQVRHVAVAVDRHFLFVELVGLGAAARVIGPVIEVVGGAAEDAEEVVVAALDRAEIRQEAEMPLADQRRAVAGGAQQRRQGRMTWRQADGLGRRRVDRLLEADGQPILIAPGDQRRPRRRTDGRVGVGLGEFQPLEREPVDVRRRVVLLAVAAHVGIAEVVGEDEDDVRLGGLVGGLGSGPAQSRRGRRERTGRAGNEITTRQARSIRHRLSPLERTGGCGQFRAGRYAKFPRFPKGCAT